MFYARRRRSPAERSAVPEGEARRRATGRRADASVPARGVRVHGFDVADPSGRLPRPRACWVSACGRRPRRSRRCPKTCIRTLTTRERVMLQTKPANCQSCHAVINPLGFTLERFDAVGRYRTQDNGKPIDATGSYETRTRQDREGLRRSRTGGVPGRTARKSTRRSSQQLFHHLVQQPVRAYGPTTLTDLRQAFREEWVQRAEAGGGDCDDGGGAEAEKRKAESSRWIRHRICCHAHAENSV